MAICDEIYDKQGKAELEKFLDAIRVVPVESGIEFHLDCSLGHYQATLNTAAPITRQDIDNVYTSLYNFYSFDDKKCPPETQ